MGTIEQDLAAIRTAVYGKDVREAIADGIENCYNETSQSGYSQLNTRVTSLEQDALDEKGRLDTVIDNVLELGGRTTSAENDIDSLTEDLNTVNVDISSLDSRVTNVETDISNVYGMTEATRNKLYITNHTTHGDSYSVNGVTVYVNDDGSFSFNGTVVTSDAIIGLMGCTSKTDYKISLGSTYTFGRKSVIDAGGSSNPSINLRYDYSSAQNNTITSGVPVSFTNAASVYLRLVRGNTYTRATRYFIWAEEGESIHEFVPYGSTAVDIVSRETINGTNELIDELKNDVIEKSHNLFYITANPSPMSNFASAGNGLYYRVNSDSSVTIYGTASATTRLPLMGCSTTTDYSVVGQRYLCLSRELIGGTYSGNIPIKYAANGSEIAIFPLSTPVYISDTAVFYLQIASGANFGTSSSPATIRWQFTEGNRVEDVYEPYDVNVAKDIYARGKLEASDKRIDYVETALSPAMEQLPEYYHTNNYIENKIKTILNRAANIKTSAELSYRSSSGTATRNGEIKNGYDAFAFITDMHLWWLDRGISDVASRNEPPTVEVINGMQSVKLLEAIRERANVTKIFNGGDMLRGNVTTLDNLKLWLGKSREYLDPIWDDTYFCIGNHEWNNPGSQTGSGTQEDEVPSFSMLYQMFVGDKADRYGSISDLGDYWIDNEAEQIRYFVIHCSPGSFIHDISITWFANEMLEVPDGYTVVLVTHNVSSLDDWDTKYTPSFDEVAKIINAARTRVAYSFGTKTWNYQYAKYDIACVLTGHTHADRFQYIPRDDTNGVPVICTTSDHWGQSAGSNGRTPGTVTEQAFDIVQLDTTNRTVWLTRIGGVSGNTDRVFNYPAGIQNGKVKPYGIVRYDEAQELTDDQKLQARANIGISSIFIDGTSLVVIHEEPDDYYNRWIWKLSDGEFEVMKNSFGYDATNNVIRIHTSSASAIRRSIVTERGIVPFKVGNTDDDSIYFPIPVPPSATGVSMQITPSTLQTACHISRYTQDGKYEQLYDTGWTSSRSFEFTSGDNLVFTMGLRVDSNNSNFSDSTEPTEIVIQFES